MPFSVERPKPQKFTAVKKTGQLTLDILEAIAERMLMFELNGRYRYAYMRDGMAGVRRLLDAEEARAVKRRYDDLRRRKLILERKRGKKLEATLTDRGTERYFQLRMGSAAKRTDGKRLLVTYDIPERLRHIRDALRHLLKKAGFRRHQQSVWVTDLDVQDDLKTWIDRNRLGDWVHIHEI